MPTEARNENLKKLDISDHSRKKANLRKDGIQNPLQIQIQWHDRFFIDAEKLELDDLANNPLKQINPEKMVGKQFIPYKIQIQAWEEITKGRFLLLISGTGSGKTLAILLGIIEVLLENKGRHSLIMYPMKALAQDQEGRLRELCSELDLTIQRYDSSISAEAKTKIRKKPGEILIITPDSLIGSIIRTKDEAWYNYLTCPSMIWVDEFHATSGTLGTALCYLIRALYLRYPALRVFFTSATLANVEEIARLFPHPTTIIRGGSRHGNIKFHIGTVKDFKKVLDLVLYDKGQFLIFIENKRLIEKLITEEDLRSCQVDRYHADLPDDERHLILSKFAKKELKGLLCTSAVSLGIDIPSVNNIILYGFPRSFSLLFQEMGRGTRDYEASGKVFLLLDASKLIDSYYSTHLEDLKKDIHAYRADPMIIDLLNEKILRGMILFAIKLGLDTKGQLSQIFPEAHSIGKLERVLTWLLVRGLTSKSAGAYVYFGEQANAFLFAFISNLRPGFPKFKIITRIKDEERKLGYITAEAIPYRACKGNYYIKEDQCYLIQEIDRDRQEIRVVEHDAHYTSQNLVWTEVALMNDLKNKGSRVRFADFKVQIRPLLLRNCRILENNQPILEEELDPNKNQDTFVLNFETKGLTLDFNLSPDMEVSQMVLYQLSKIILQNAAVLINISEKEVDCFQNHADRMLYFLDRSCPTGVSQQLYENLESILEKTYQILADCPCSDGCNKCAVPAESSYLMPNFNNTEDIYRKKEILTLLRRFLHESGFIR